MAYEFILEAAMDAAKRRYSNGHPPAPDDTVCVLFTTSGQIYTGISGITMQGGVQNSIHAEVDAVNRMRVGGETAIQAMTVLNSYSMVPILPCAGCINFILSLNYENQKCLAVFPGGSMKLTEIGMNFGNPSPNQAQRNTSGSQYMGNQPNYQNYGNSVYLNPNNSVYQNPNNSVYQNPNNSVYQNPGSSIHQSSGSSVYMNQMARQLSQVSRQMSQISRQMPQSMSAVPPPPPSGPSGGTAKENSYLKNKLNNILSDDVDEEEQENKPKKKKGLFG